MLYKCLYFIVQVAVNSPLRSDKTATLTHQFVDEPKLKKAMRDQMLVTVIVQVKTELLYRKVRNPHLRSSVHHRLFLFTFRDWMPLLLIHSHNITSSLR